MEIALDFARMLLEADQLARTDRLDQATVIYQNMMALGGIDRFERALVEARLERVHGEQEERAQPSIQAVDREAEPEVPTAEARAEALVNQGKLAAAIAVYGEIAAVDPGNALVRERLSELRAQLPSAPVPVAAVALGSSAGDWRDGLPADSVILLQTLLERIQANRRIPA